MGLELASLRGALAASAGGSAFLDRHLGSLLSGDYLETFGLDRCVDELEITASLAAENDVPFELSGLVTRLHREALARFGAVDGELLVAKLLEERATTRLRLNS
jgi:3-hydroxyisobutyrate dehydrogenase